MALGVNLAHVSRRLCVFAVWGSSINEGWLVVLTGPSGDRLEDGVPQLPILYCIDWVKNLFRNPVLKKKKKNLFCNWRHPRFTRNLETRDKISQLQNACS